MKGFKEQSFADRRNAATVAKQAALARFKARPGPDDPAVIERQRQRQALVEARETRAAQKLADKIAAEETARREAEVREAARLAAEETARREAEAKAHAERTERLARAERERAERRAREEREKIEKAERDAIREHELAIAREARYAARKLAKKTGRRL